MSDLLVRATTFSPAESAAGALKLSALVFATVDQYMSTGCGCIAATWILVEVHVGALLGLRLHSRDPAICVQPSCGCTGVKCM